MADRITRETVSSRRSPGGSGWFRFSLRSLLVGLTLAGLFFAGIGGPIAEQYNESKIAKQIKEVDGGVGMEFKPKGSIQKFLYSWGWVRQPYRRITSVTLNSNPNADSKKVIESNISLERLQELRHLRRLSCSGCGLDDEDMEHIAKCSSLMDIDISNNPDITDVGLKKLSHRFERPKLKIAHTSVTNRCLRAVTQTLSYNDFEQEKIVLERTKQELTTRSPLFMPVSFQIGPQSTPYGMRREWGKSSRPIPNDTFFISSRSKTALTPIRQFLISGLEQDQKIWLELSPKNISSNEEGQLKDLAEKLQFLAIDGYYARDKSIEEILSFVGDLPHLETLLIRRAKTCGDLTGLQGFPNLRELSISDTPGIDDVAIEQISVAKKLQILRLPKADVTFSGVLKLRNGLRRKLEILELPPTFSEIRPLLEATATKSLVKNQR